MFDALEFYDSALSEHQDAVDDYDDVFDDYNAILAEAEEADAEAQAAFAEREEFCERYTRVPGECNLTLPIRVLQMVELIERGQEAFERAAEASERARGLRGRVDASEDRAMEAGEIADDALIIYECWMGVAAASEYPGHIPDHECPAPE